jgi:hypothetical protein
VLEAISKSLVSSMIKKGTQNSINPYKQSPGCRKMLPSFVCYADILGYSDLSKKSIQSGKGEQFLKHLGNALSTAYKHVRENAEGFIGQSFYETKVFTDNIVVGYPLFAGYREFGDPELDDILGVFAKLQASLSAKGFFLRGGIAYGEHYMDEDIVFGNAFLEAAGLDKKGGPPRLMLAPSAEKIVRKRLNMFEKVELSPLYEYLLEDTDGTLFLNYLSEVFSVFPEGGIFWDLISGHHLAITKNLLKYKETPDVYAKYEWSAHYHNFICQEFISNNPLPLCLEDNWEYALAMKGAEKMPEYLINIKSNSVPPHRISAK